MDIIRHIGGRSAGGEVRVTAQVDHLSRKWHRGRFHSLLMQGQAHGIIDHDTTEVAEMPILPERIVIQPLDELLNGLLSVASYRRWVATSRRLQLAIPMTNMR